VAATFFTPAVLLFDLGGVLVDFSGFSALRELCPPGAMVDEAEIRRRWLESPAVRAFERGAIEPLQFAERLAAEWRIDLAPGRLLAEFVAWNRGFYPGAERLLRALRGRHRIACLSNSNVAHWEARPELEPLFDDVFLSHRLGAVKPDAEAFTRTVALLGVAPDNVHYFDDAPANVEAARRAGMRATHVHPPGLASLERELATLGLLPGLAPS
jgi:putative hydrolase of the HAD superfamily